VLLPGDWKHTVSAGTLQFLIYSTFMLLVAVTCLVQMIDIDMIWLYCGSLMLLLLVTFCQMCNFNEVIYYKNDSFWITFWNRNCPCGDIVTNLFHSWDCFALILTIFDINIFCCDPITVFTLSCSLVIDCDDIFMAYLYFYLWVIQCCLWSCFTCSTCPKNVIGFCWAYLTCGTAT